MFQIRNLLVKNILKIDQLILSANIITIEGQSGSGKSTLLRLLNNLDDPTSGTIFFKEKPLTSFTPQQLRKKVVMVPQNPVIFEGSIRDNLLIGLTLSTEKLVEDDRLEQMLKLFWLDKNLNENASDVSGGEKQRIALARVLMIENAEVFLLDEPTSELDDRTRDHVMKNFIKIARQQNQKIIMVTHDHHITEMFAEDVIQIDSFSKNSLNKVEN